MTNSLLEALKTIAQYYEWNTDNTIVNKDSYDALKEFLDGNNQITDPNVQKEYLKQFTIEFANHRNYNPDFGDNKECECGHVYYRHFDSYEDNYPCGCKYCGCDTFKEKQTPKIEQ